MKDQEKYRNNKYTDNIKNKDHKENYLCHNDYRTYDQQ